MLPPKLHLEDVPWTQVKVADAFWSPRLETNRTKTILHGFDMLREHGYEENFIRAGQRLEGGFQGLVYQDSDVYKILESAAASLATHEDPQLGERFNYWVGLLERAQLEDGYVNTYFQLKEPDKKWTNLRDWHELYCAGHLVEAAVVDFLGSGSTRLLNVAKKCADHIDNRFGPNKTEGYPGHPELELALIKLAKVTGDHKYHELARHFVMNRGLHYFAKEHGTPEEEYKGAYWQDRVPIAELDVIEGHAVRAAYLLCAATDLVFHDDIRELEQMILRVWANATGKRMYATGGIGNSAANEGFTTDYDLPNKTAYQETCASISMIFWNHRLSLLYGNSVYADAMERALYNGAIAGISLSGTKFFYENPLASEGQHHRRDWYACACCPPNISRLLSSLGSYIYMKGQNSFWLNLFVAGEVSTEVGGNPFVMQVETAYPWDGRVLLTPISEREIDILIRIPSWCREFHIEVDDQPISPTMRNGYAVVSGTWNSGKKIQINFQMPVERIQSHPLVPDNLGKVAISHGPLIYCFEQTDQSEELEKVSLPIEASLTCEPFDIEGHEVTSLVGDAHAHRIDWPGGLYRFVDAPAPTKVRAIPYAFWDNRQPGSMAVWMPTSVPTPREG